MGNNSNIQAWTKSAANNDDADADINWSEGQDPGTVNNSARGMMAAIAKYADDRDGRLSAGGTANAITLTTNQGLSASHIAAGLTLAFRVTATNTGAVTLNPDSIGAVAIVDQSGNALTGGELVVQSIATVMYNNNTSNWRLVSAHPTGTVAIADGGTGATTAANARTNLGVGTVLLASGTASSNATLDIDVGGFSEYSHLELILDSFRPASLSLLQMQFSTDGGSSFLSSGYHYAVSSMNSNTGGDGGSIASGGSTASSIVLTSSGVRTGAAEALNGVFTLLGSPLTALYPRVHGVSTFVGSSSVYYRSDGFGFHTTAADVTNVRFLFSAGNIASGNYTVYGLR